MSGHPTTLPWDAEALWRRLAPALPGLSIEVLARCESTNTVLLDRCRAVAGSRTTDGPAPHGRRSADLLPCLLVAETQTHGRGRLGRDWMAATGASLTFSLALPLAPRGPGGWSGLSLAVGCALADALDPPGPAADGAGAPPRVGLKWPNDLWLIDGPGRGRKLGGILIETVPVGDRRMLVVGIGLNLRPLEDPAAGSLEHGYASVSELDADPGAPQVLARLAPPLVQALQRFEAEGLAPFAADYARRDLLAGQEVVTRGAEPALDGVCEGVQPDGALRLRRPDGTLTLLVSGEVSVRLRPAESTQPC